MALLKKRNTSCVIYTFIVGDYDILRDPNPSHLSPNWEYVCFTNNGNIKSKVWDIRPIPEEYLEFNDPKRIASLLKIEYYNLFSSDYEYVVSIDANISLNYSLGHICDHIGVSDSQYDMFIVKHPDRKCAYSEIQKVKELKFDDLDVLDETTKHFRDLRYPANNGLYETGIIFRKNKAEWVKEYHKNWSRNYRKFSRRDQVTVNFSLWELYKQKPRLYQSNRAKIKLMRDIYTHKGNNPNFTLHRHCDKSSKSKIPSSKIINTPINDVNESVGEVYYFIGYDGFKNLGESYNRNLRILPNDNDWAVFFDSDTICTTSDFGTIIESAIRDYPQADAFTCYTNRVNCKWQIAPDVNVESNDMLYHRTFGELCRIKNQGECIDVTKQQKNKVMSGMFFALKKSTWKACGEFPNKGMLGIDNHLHWQLMKKKKKLYLIKSLYVYHWYRNNDNTNTAHLKK